MEVGLPAELNGPKVFGVLAEWMWSKLLELTVAEEAEISGVFWTPLVVIVEVVVMVEAEVVDVVVEGEEAVVVVVVVVEEEVEAAFLSFSKRCKCHLRTNFFFKKKNNNKSLSGI